MEFLFQEYIIIGIILNLSEVDHIPAFLERPEKSSQANAASATNHAAIAIWKNIFSRIRASDSKTIADLCPGDDPKIESALRDAGFQGSLFAIDSSPSRIRQLEHNAGQVPFSCVPVIGSLSSTCIPQCDIIAANHPIDDLALSFFASRTGETYDVLYSRFREDPEFSRHIWERISKDLEIKQQVAKLLCEVAGQTRHGGYFAVSQYPSKYELANRMESELGFCSSVLEEISRRLVSSGEFSLCTDISNESVQGHPIYLPGHWLVLKRAEPFFRKIELQITRVCNLACAYCCAIKDTHNDGNSVAVAKKLAEANRRFRIGITGGEPFLFDKLETVLRILAERGAEVSVTTNGTVSRPEIFTYLRTLGVRVKMSVHGPREYHDGITGVMGSFDMTVQTIRQLVDARIKVAVQTNLHLNNVANAATLADFCNRLGVSELKVFPLMIQGKARKESWRAQSLSEELFTGAISNIRARAEEIGWSGNLRTMAWPNSGHYILVLPSGEVTAGPLENSCGYISIGNLLRQEVHELWEAYPFKETHLRKYDKHDAN